MYVCDLDEFESVGGEDEEWMNGTRMNICICIALPVKRLAMTLLALAAPDGKGAGAVVVRTL